MLELRNTHIQNGDITTTTKVGDVVIIHEKTKRNFWRLGIIVRLLKGDYEKVRAVTLKTSKNGKPIYLNRTIEKLYPLELGSQEIVNEADVSYSSETYNLEVDDDDDIGTRDRPRREAADNGVLIRRLLGYS